MTRKLEKVGVPDAGLKEHEAPPGSPLLHERLTDCNPQPVGLTLIALEPVAPCGAVMPPEAVTEKSNDDDSVKDSVAT